MNSRITILAALVILLVMSFSHKSEALEVVERIDVSDNYTYTYKNPLLSEYSYTKKKKSHYLDEAAKQLKKLDAKYNYFKYENKKLDIYGVSTDTKIKVIVGSRFGLKIRIKF